MKRPSLIHRSATALTLVTIALTVVALFGGRLGVPAIVVVVADRIRWIMLGGALAQGLLLLVAEDDDDDDEDA